MRRATGASCTAKADFHVRSTSVYDWLPTLKLARQRDRTAAHVTRHLFCFRHGEKLTGGQRGDGGFELVRVAW